MSSLCVQQIAHRFNGHQALDGVSLDIGQGEFFSLLGPSGCGKTTLLNIIAGFLAADRGRILLGGQDMSQLPAYRRPIGMVFQSYALFPHLSVFENVAYGLRVKRMPTARIAERVHEVLALVRLVELADRMPRQLSGGQQQRVAIARALAIEPQVLLLDEPLSNLDAKLRKQMQAELRAIQQRVGITTILVTHDQEEALSLSDRIAVMGQGRVQQVGTPMALYRQPANPFVAQFIGQANLLTVRPVGPGELLAEDYFTAPGQALRLQAAAANTAPHAAGTQQLLLRPERIRLSAALDPAVSALNHTRATLRAAHYTGALLQLVFTLPAGGELLVHSPDQGFGAMPSAGSQFDLSWQPDDLITLPAVEAI